MGDNELSKLWEVIIFPLHLLSFRSVSVPLSRIHRPAVQIRNHITGGLQALEISQFPLETKSESSPLCDSLPNSWSKSKHISEEKTIAKNCLSGVFEGNSEPPKGKIFKSSHYPDVDRNKCLIKCVTIWNRIGNLWQVERVDHIYSVMLVCDHLRPIPGSGGFPGSERNGVCYAIIIR